jgi:hypothetical protein
MKGDFALNVEEPGDYTVQAFFAGKKVGPAIPVTVAAADLDLAKTPLKVADEKSAAALDKADEERAKAEAEKAKAEGGAK